MSKINFSEGRSRVGHPAVTAVGAFAAAAGAILMAGIAMERAGVISLPFNIASASVPSPIITESPYPEHKIPVQRLDPAVTVLLQDPDLQALSARSGNRIVVTESVATNPDDGWIIRTDKYIGNNERKATIESPDNLIGVFKARIDVLARRILEGIVPGSFFTWRWGQTENNTWINIRRNGQINAQELSEPIAAKTRVVYDSANPSK